MLRGEEDLAVAVERLFQGAHGGFPADHKGGHHLREDDHLADGHHREFALCAVLGVAIFGLHGPPD